MRIALGMPNRATRSNAVWAVLAVAVAAVSGVIAVGDPMHILKIFIIVVILCAAVAAIKRPNIGLLMVLVAGCFEQTVSLPGGLQVGSAEVALTLFAPAMMKAWRRGAFSRSVRVSAGLLVFGAALSSVFAETVSAAAWGAIRWALLLNAVLAGVSYLRGAGEAGMRQFAAAFAVLGGAVTALGWLQVHGHYTIVGPAYNPPLPDSSFGYYSNYASFIASASVISFGMTLHMWRRNRPTLLLLMASCCALTGFGVIEATSRGAVALLAGGLLTILALRVGRPGQLVKTGTLLAVTAALVYALTPAELVQGLTTRFTTTQGGDNTRYVLQDAGRFLLSQHPQGIGFGNFESYVASGVVTADQALAHAHNLFIQTGLDDGWIGLLGFLGLSLLAILNGGLKGWRSRGDALQGVFAAALAGFLAQGLNDYFFFETGSLIVFGAILAGALALSRDESEDSEPSLMQVSERAIA